MSNSPRVRKMADQIHRVLAERLQKGLRDPDMGYVTITDVKVTGDLQHATVFYTVLGTDDEREASGKALARATGMLRTEVGRHMRVRLVPTLEFVLDALPGTVEDIDRLLDEAKQRDEQLRDVAAGAQPAGDADPYRSEDADDSAR
ncbi:Ribosome-binding factor A [Pontimonas salivibrio]|uniref:Ribosome-binding factor A n=1 Tax=Pontimonas salivibrio TaxID=1159327 RepID=A0A2L2BPL6_9MICO|nr:30S ribosome-binding factor RbfA [Pontimonas salivibrio]AVG23611.1 Ribosome-binding factor A [Pontimonas salivibrio]